MTTQKSETAAAANDYLNAQTRHMMMNFNQMKAFWRSAGAASDRTEAEARKIASLLLTAKNS